METTVSSDYVKYKESEKRYIRTLVGEEECKEGIIARVIVEATKRAVESRGGRFQEQDLDNLKRVINRRLLITEYYAKIGRSCPGHAPWLEVLQGSHRALRDDWQRRKTKAQTLPASSGEPDKLIVLLENLELDPGGKSKKSMPAGEKHKKASSYENILEEVLFICSLNSIVELGDWLRAVWGRAIEGEVDFATLGHREFSIPNDGFRVVD